MGTVSRLIELPSCEALEARPARGQPLLVPMVKEAVRRVEVAAGRIDVDCGFLGLAESSGRRWREHVNVDIFTLFPEWFDWFACQRHVANVLGAGSQLHCVNYRDHTPLSGGQVDDTPFGGGAGMVLRVDVLEQRAARSLRRRSAGAALAAPRDRARPGRAAAR